MIAELEADLISLSKETIELIMDMIKRPDTVYNAEIREGERMAVTMRSPGGDAVTFYLRLETARKLVGPFSGN